MKNFKIHSLIILFASLSIVSCSSRKYATKLPSAAAKAADAMASLKSKDLYHFITDWTGVKYKFGGLDKSGIDCSGFALLLEKKIYGHHIPRVSKDQANFTKKINLSDLKEGDLIFFAFGGNQVDHVGVYLNNNYFVHASTTRGVVVDDLNLPVYQNAIVKAGSLN